MAEPKLVFGKMDDRLRDAPIRAEWVLSGAPRARNAVLAVSADRLATTLVWDCTAGRFRWIYDTDETIHIVEGGVRLTDTLGVVRDLGVGDVVFFPAGSSAEWEVQSYVRKLAFFRKPAPQPVSFAIRAAHKLAQLSRTGAGSVGGGSVGGMVLAPGPVAA